MNTQRELETTLYIVRHGETECNRNHIVQGRGIDVPLNENGISQAKALARFKDWEVDVAYSSTLLRAKQTAKIFLEGKDNIPLAYLSDLEEMSWGIYEGMQQSEELKSAFKKMKSAWAQGDYAFRIEQGETLLEVQKRGVSALNYIVSRHAGQKILVVSHGRFIRVLLASLLEGYDLSRMKELRQDNTAFNHIVFNNGQYRAENLRCVLHLSERSEALN